MSDGMDYRTSDLYFAAFLRVAGVEHTDTVKEDARIFFIFSQPDGGMRDLKNQYFNRTAKVSALGFSDEIRGLKALMHMADDEA